jgi:hypothetical protein
MRQNAWIVHFDMESAEIAVQNLEKGPIMRKNIMLSF